MNPDEISAFEARGAGAYPSDDGDSCVVVLKKPLSRSDGVEIRVIDLRSPTVGEVDKAGGRHAILQMQEKAIANILGVITTPQITSGMYKAMPLSDTQSFCNAVISFFVPN